MPTSLIERRSALLAEARDLIPAEGAKMSPEAYEKATSVMDEFDKVDAEIKAAAKSGSLIDRVKGASVETTDAGADDVKAAPTLGHHFVKHAGDILTRQANGAHIESAAPEFETRAADDPVLTPNADGSTVAHLAPWATEFRRDIVNAKREKLVIADLMGVAQVSPQTQTISYLVEKMPRVREGGAGVVAEGARKPFVRFNDFDIVSEKLTKIAALTRITEETAQDLTFVRSWINNQLIYELSVVEEAQLLNGDGTGANVTGLLNREGVQQHDITGDLFDGIFLASQKVPEFTDLQPDALVVNTADYVRIRLAKDKNGQYLAGGPFTGQYGNGGVQINPEMWGLRTIDTPAIERGTYVLGAFRQGATVLRKGGIRVDSTNTNRDDFEYNLITLRAEERLGLMVERPAAFVTGSLAGAEIPGAPAIAGTGQ